MGIDEEIEQFYSKGNILPYLGSDDFTGGIPGKIKKGREVIASNIDLKNKIEQYFT